ncbi:MAG TPA: hypothetical protein VGR47_20480 [Terracidiphilus sp.]|nr:hypothetical protein [Terracidiphilus sp.]
MALARDIAHAGDRPRTIADEQHQGELQIAWGHAMWRNNLVAKVFCYLSVMRAAGLIAKGARVVVSPDSLPVPQDFQATHGNQAAHYLPGFVAAKQSGPRLVYLWDLAKDAGTRREIGDLFRATQDLPPGYNRADSAAEGKARRGPVGLKKIFEQCCQTIVDLEPPRSNVTNDVLVCISRPAVMTAYRQWAQASTAAYERAWSGKVDRIAVKRPGDVHSAPTTNLSQGKFHEWTAEEIAARVRDLDRTVSGRKGSVGEFQDQASFLRAYAKVTNHEFLLSEAAMRQIEDRFSKMPDWYTRY